MSSRKLTHIETDFLVKSLNYSITSKALPNKNIIASKEFKSDLSIIILPADKVRSTVILNYENSLEKCMDHINNGPYQLLKKDPITKIKAKTLIQLKVLEDNEFIDNILYFCL